jgi:hypothetical protein
MAQVWCYIARETRSGAKHPIDTVVCVTVDCPEYVADNAKLIAGWMRNGLTIERVPVEWARLHLFTSEPSRPPP